MQKNPVQVDIAKDLIKLRQHRKKEKKMFSINNKNEWKSSSNEYLNDDQKSNRYQGDGLFVNAMVDFEYKIRNRSNEMKKS